MHTNIWGNKKRKVSFRKGKTLRPVFQGYKNEAVSNSPEN